MTQDSGSVDEKTVNFIERVVEFRYTLPESQQALMDGLAIKAMRPSQRIPIGKEAPPQDDLNDLGKKLQALRETLSDDDKVKLDSLILASGSVESDADVIAHAAAPVWQPSTFSVYQTQIGGTPLQTYDLKRQWSLQYRLGSYAGR
jgi:hypothetical protein